MREKGGSTDLVLKVNPKDGSVKLNTKPAKHLLNDLKPYLPDESYQSLEQLVTNLSGFLSDLSPERVALINQVLSKGTDYLEILASVSENLKKPDFKIDLDRIVDIFSRKIPEGYISEKGFAKEQGISASAILTAKARLRKTTSTKAKELKLRLEENQKKFHGKVFRPREDFQDLMHYKMPNTHVTLKDFVKEAHTSLSVFYRNIETLKAMATPEAQALLIRLDKRSKKYGNYVYHNRADLDAVTDLAEPKPPEGYVSIKEKGIHFQELRSKIKTLKAWKDPEVDALIERIQSNSVIVGNFSYYPQGDLEFFLSLPLIPRGWETVEEAAARLDTTKKHLMFKMHALKVSKSETKQALYKKFQEKKLRVKRLRIHPVELYDELTWPDPVPEGYVTKSDYAKEMSRSISGVAHKIALVRTLKTEDAQSRTTRLEENIKLINRRTYYKKTDLDAIMALDKHVMPPGFVSKKQAKEKTGKSLSRIAKILSRIKQSNDPQDQETYAQLLEQTQRVGHTSYFPEELFLKILEGRVPEHYRLMSQFCKEHKTFREKLFRKINTLRFIDSEPAKELILKLEANSIKEGRSTWYDPNDLEAVLGFEIPKPEGFISREDIAEKYQIAIGSVYKVLSDLNKSTCKDEQDLVRRFKETKQRIGRLELFDEKLMELVFGLPENYISIEDFEERSGLEPGSIVKIKKALYYKKTPEAIAIKDRMKKDLIQRKKVLYYPTKDLEDMISTGISKPIPEGFVRICDAATLMNCSDSAVYIKIRNYGRSSNPEKLRLHTELMETRKRIGQGFHYKQDLIERIMDSSVPRGYISFKSATKKFRKGLKTFQRDLDRLKNSDDPQDRQLAADIGAKKVTISRKIYYPEELLEKVFESKIPESYKTKKGFCEARGTTLAILNRRINELKRIGTEETKQILNTLGGNLIVDKRTHWYDPDDLEAILAFENPLTKGFISKSEYCRRKGTTLSMLNIKLKKLQSIDSTEAAIILTNLEANAQGTGHRKIYNPDDFDELFKFQTPVPDGYISREQASDMYGLTVVQIRLRLKHLRDSENKKDNSLHQRIKNSKQYINHTPHYDEDLMELALSLPANYIPESKFEIDHSLDAGRIPKLRAKLALDKTKKAQTLNERLKKSLERRFGYRYYPQEDLEELCEFIHNQKAPSCKRTPYKKIDVPPGYMSMDEMAEHANTTKKTLGVTFSHIRTGRHGRSEKIQPLLATSMVIGGKLYVHYKVLKAIRPKIPKIQQYENTEPIKK